jgi:hydroxymethylpyrimidine/phosphomethylpyrimidine kinase
VRDCLVTVNGVEVFESPRLLGRSTHGTGCTLSSAIATGLAQGLNIRDSIARARVFVFEAIRAAPGFGSGHGPLNHGFGIAHLDLETKLLTPAD